MHAPVSLIFLSSCYTDSCEILSVENGMISYSNSTLAIGTTTQYTCDTGYGLIGESIRACIFLFGNIIWGYNNPICISK